MPRSLKKGPFVDQHLRVKVERMTAHGKIQKLRFPPEPVHP